MWIILIERSKAVVMFSVVLITGARQVGRTTLLKHNARDIPYFTLDDPLLLQSAIDDAGSFFKTAPPPGIVDEIQYAPNLFMYMKMIADESGKNVRLNEKNVTIPMTWL